MFVFSHPYPIGLDALREKLLFLFCLVTIACMSTYDGLENYSKHFVPVLTPFHPQNNREFTID